MSDKIRKESIQENSSTDKGLLKENDLSSRIDESLDMTILDFEVEDIAFSYGEYRSIN